MTRRAPLLLVALLAACGGGEPPPRFPGVFVFGFDGMEPTIVEREMAAGNLPNFSRLAAAGGYSRLATTLPPESPVAWATFLTGRDPGAHGIFDFLARDVRPEGGIALKLSAAATEPPSSFIPFFGYRLPLSAGGTTCTVGGRFFYETIAEAGIPVSVLRVPSNYPPRGDHGERTFSGMGTPDILGSYGVFSLFCESPPLDAPEWEENAHVMPLEFRDGKAESVLRGPRNDYLPEAAGRAPAPYATVPLVVYADRERGAARVDVGERMLLLRPGEWSEFVRVDFPLIPGLVSAGGIVRFYLKSLSPFVALYASPVNIDPADPEVPLSTPPEASPDLAARIGPHYTQGMAEDTQAHRLGALDFDEFMAQARFVLAERERMLAVEVERFRRLGGFAFFYFSTTDLCAHMLMRYLDEGHPLWVAEEAAARGRVLVEIYREMDRILGEFLDSAPPGTRIVALSDHGFKPLRREMDLNAWLCENGYLAVWSPERRDEIGNYDNVKWSETKAYAVGFSGIFLNLVGRERPGCVMPGPEADAVARQIADRLEAVVDPATGERPVTKVYRREDVYHGERAHEAPDLVVGFNVHYGCADESVNGFASREVLRDVRDAWSGDHLMDPSHVPGILLVNAPITLADPSLQDLAASILAEFGLPAGDLPSRRIWGR